MSKIRLNGDNLLRELVRYIGTEPDHRPGHDLVADPGGVEAGRVKWL